MKLHEYQDRQILAEYGIPVPASEIVRSPEQAEQVVVAARSRMSEARGRKSEKDI